MEQANEATLVYTRAIEEANDLQLIRVGNQGDLFFMSKKGLFRLRNDRNPQFEIVNPTICSLAVGEEAGRLGKVTVDSDGREICYEVITPEGGLKDRFFKLLGGKKSSGESLLAHQVVHFNVTSNRGLNFPAALVETRREYTFHWGMSPTGRFLVLARPEKKTYNLQLIDVNDESIIADFQMSLAVINDVWVNDAGVVMVDVRQVGEEKLIIALPDNKTRHSFTPPPTYRVLNLGPLHVTVLLESQRRLMIFDYPGNVVADVDLQPLRQLGVQFDFNFNERGDLDVLGWQGGTLRLQHSDVKAILVDAKRWDLTARQHQAEEEQLLVHEATMQHLQERKRLEEFQLSRQLLDAVQTDFSQPSALTPNTPRLGGERKGPPQPLPPPLPQVPSVPHVPEIPQPSAEAPPWMVGRGSTPPPPPPPIESVPPLPPAAIPPVAVPHVVVPTPATPPPPLAFLSGGSPLPPPDTEGDDAASAPSVPAPVPTPSAPPPVAAPPPPTPAVTLTNFQTTSDLDAELERLRMTYIAGEISRDVYYKTRAELESQRRNLQTADSPLTSGPMRLDIDMDIESPAPSLGHVRPTIRPKSLDMGPSLELPLPGDDD